MPTIGWLSCDAAGRAVERARRRRRRCRRRRRRASSPLPVGVAAMPTIGWFRRRPPVEPWKRGVAEGEDAAVGGDEPVAVAGRCRADVDDRAGSAPAHRRPVWVVAASAAGEPMHNTAVSAQMLAATIAPHRRPRSTCSPVVLRWLPLGDRRLGFPPTGSDRCAITLVNHPASQHSAPTCHRSATDATVNQDFAHDARAWLDGHVNLETGVGIPASARPPTAPTRERIDALLAYSARRSSSTPPSTSPARTARRRPRGW